MTLRYAWHKPPMKARDLGSVTQSEAKSLLFGRREKQILRPGHTGALDDATVGLA